MPKAVGTSASLATPAPRPIVRACDPEIRRVFGFAGPDSAAPALPSLRRPVLIPGAMAEAL